MPEDEQTYGDITPANPFARAIGLGSSPRLSVLSDNAGMGSTSVLMTGCKELLVVASGPRFEDATFFSRGTSVE